MEPLAWVHTRLINVNLSQRIDVTVNAESNGCAECCEQVRLIHEGEFFDTAFSCLAYSGKVVTHKGNYRNAGGNVMLIDFEGTTLAYDTLFVEITY